MFEELGISGGTAIIILIAFYFVIKWAVKNGINESVIGEIKKEVVDINEELKKSREELKTVK